MMVNKAEDVYYMLWKILYGVPAWIRYAIEISVIIFVGCLFLHIVKRIGFLLCFILKKMLSEFILGMQSLLKLPFNYLNDGLKNKAARIDNKLNILGNIVVEVMEKGQAWFKKTKITVSKRQQMIFFGILFIATILPEFKVIQSLNTPYRTVFCIAQNHITKFEHILTPKIDEYPELFKENNKKEETETAVGEIYLQLNDKGANGANVRKNPSLNAESIMVVNSKNKIIYLGEKQYDGRRYWLKVKVDNMENTGWLSENLVEKELHETDEGS